MQTPQLPIRPSAQAAYAACAPLPPIMLPNFGYYRPSAFQTTGYNLQYRQWQSQPAASIYNQPRYSSYRQALGYQQRSVVQPTRATATDANTLTHEQLSTYKVVDLQALLVSRGLPKSGKKSQLIDRIISSQNAATGGTSLQEAAYHEHVAQQSVQAPTSQPRQVRRRSPAQYKDDIAFTQQLAAPDRQDSNQSSHSSYASALQTDGAPASHQTTYGNVTTSSQLWHTRQSQVAPNDNHIFNQSPHASQVQAPVQPVSPNRNTAQARGRQQESIPNPPAGLPAGLELPPMPELRRGAHWAIHERNLSSQELKAHLLSNPTDLQITVLGTAAVTATSTRALASIALCRGRDVWLFDAGDDTQRQLAAVPHVKPSKVFRIFITSLTTETMLGLPGLLCTLGAARVRGHEDADIPIHIYGPAGIADYLTSMFKVSHTYLEANVLVVELVSHAVEPEQRQPTMYNRRARIFRAVVPPDQLNPDGYFNGDLAAFMPTQGRAIRKRGAKAGGGVLSIDSRAGFLPFPELLPGDPTRTDVRVQDMTWTIQADPAARITAMALQAEQTTFAYGFQEADRSGMLCVERCKALGVRAGNSYSMLKEGISVQTQEGHTITPDMVITANKPGRKVVIMGNTSHISQSSAFTSIAQSADVLISGHVEATTTTSSPKSRNGVPTSIQSPASLGLHDSMSAKDIGSLAARLGIGLLMLARFGTPGYESNTNANANINQGMPSTDEVEMPLLNLQKEPHVEAAWKQACESAEATAKVAGTAVPATQAVCDYWVQVLEKHEGPLPAFSNHVQ